MNGASQLDPKTLALRQTQSVAVLAELRRKLLAWKEQLLPKHPMAEAVSYTLGQWEELTAFTSDGAVPIDNNQMSTHSRTAKPSICGPSPIGRKRYVAQELRTRILDVKLRSLTCFCGSRMRLPLRVPERPARDNHRRFTLRTVSLVKPSSHQTSCASRCLSTYRSPPLTRTRK